MELDATMGYPAVYMNPRLPEAAGNTAPGDASSPGGRAAASERATASSGDLDAKRKELRDTCEEMESVFLYELLKQMRETIQKCPLTSGGSGESTYTSLFDLHLSQEIAHERSIGLADFLYQRLEREIDATLTGTRGK